VTSADAGAAVTGIRQDAAFRTNVGFAAGADGASYTLTLQDAAGTTVAATSASLGMFGWTQPSIQDLFPTTTIPENATLIVKVTQGSVDVFDSSIDNLSGDPVVTPIAPVPTVIPSSATIGPAGGSIRSDDGRLTLRIPAGALTSSVPLSFVTNASNDAPQGTGPSYTLAPGGLTFARSATLVLCYDSDDLIGSAAGELGIAFESGSSWYVVTGGSVNAAARTLIVPIGSTAPAIATDTATRRALLDPLPYKWSAFNSIRMSPNTTALPTKGNLPLVVLDMGASSSRGGTLDGTSPLSPIDPSHLTYSWSLNGRPEAIASPADGTLVSHDGNNATYTAPQCAPVNEVLITATVGHVQSDVPGPQSKKAWCFVRVLPRDWAFTALLEEAYGCTNGAFAADHVIYAAGFKFSLDDKLNVTNVVPGESLVQFIPVASPTACDPNNGDVKRKDGGLLSVSPSGGFYDVKEEFFRLTFSVNIPGSLGYDYTYKDTGRPGEVDTGERTSFPAIAYLLGVGEFSIPMAFPGATKAELKYIIDRRTAGCP
ncbi:MAG: hypothetical protein ACM369_05215, partial [Acidobacteriota bacterium]